MVKAGAAPWKRGMSADDTFGACESEEDKLACDLIVRGPQLVGCFLCLDWPFRQVVLCLLGSLMQGRFLCSVLSFLEMAPEGTGNNCFFAGVSLESIFISLFWCVNLGRTAGSLRDLSPCMEKYHPTITACDTSYHPYCAADACGFGHRLTVIRRVTS